MPIERDAKHAALDTTAASVPLASDAFPPLVTSIDSPPLIVVTSPNPSLSAEPDSALTQQQQQPQQSSPAEGDQIEFPAFHLATPVPTPLPSTNQQQQQQQPDQISATHKQNAQVVALEQFSSQPVPSAESISAAPLSIAAPPADITAPIIESSGEEVNEESDDHSPTDGDEHYRVAPPSDSLSESAGYLGHVAAVSPPSPSGESPPVDEPQQADQRGTGET